ncbi:FixH family protein [Marinibactrum halimedae]|uniref:Nitrogen fixation protein FixH n=1 Tax=Marinibactrum halimedae TaxID=1444977 RepID=A0AA37WNM0_9GAMM|nr:FixH family protein [Marinibactrum halimedae]MCD9457919.1 FixH family protein [Marinibactrum halimedae]GLS26256.1 hypothetical protein GCM10007877_19710 [Marinibactrum halimedae]
MTDSTSKPWYQEFWAWFILFPLIAAVILGVIMVSTAFRHGDDVVTDSYYKEGRMINQSLEQDKRAAELGIIGDLRFDMELGDVNLTLTQSATSEPLPKKLQLYLDHPVSADQDMVLLLNNVAPGYYRADLEKPIRYRWYLRLEPLQLKPAMAASGNIPQSRSPQSNSPQFNSLEFHSFKPWHISGEIDFSKSQQVQLAPR